MTNHSVTAHDLFTSHLAVEANWMPGRRTVANVFIAFSSNAFYVKNVCMIAEGIGHKYEDQEAVIQKALSHYVRAKILRTRRGTAGTLYEVNF